MRFAVDTGGTFTDLVVETEGNQYRLYKAATVPEDPVEGVLNVLGVAADDLETTLHGLLSQGTLFIYGTTHAINAILTESTAKTALLVTEGHPDILLFREGGRTDIFNWTRPYPEPYVPRRLTYQVPERIRADGQIVTKLDEDAVVRIVQKLREQRVEAVAVCLLWSIVNPEHELQVGELLKEYLPGIPYTLSHIVNPAIREYRRASAAALDASLKPIMSDYLRGLVERLRSAGFKSSGRVVVVTSSGGVLDADDVAEKPIYAIGSGPATAPVAGRHYAKVDAEAETAVVADAGGTSYDVSLIRRGRIPFTRETWLGPVFNGHMTGFPSIDVRSIGAGGGSLAWVDEGGMLHVGPQSAGADPGPVCYGRGGTQPTVTDAALVMGYLDPDYFLGGAMTVDVGAAERALREQIADPLQLRPEEAAASVIKVVTENMARAIEELTIKQGIDPRTAVLVGGGGAAGLNAVAIARRLGCPLVIIPEVAAALSAAGGLMSELRNDFSATLYTNSTQFDFDGANRVFAHLRKRCEEFITGPGAGSLDATIEFSVEARYPHQIWEIEVPLVGSHFADVSDVEKLRQNFHATHQEIFAVADLESPIEVLGWHARVSCRLRESGLGRIWTESSADPVGRTLARERTVYLPGVGRVRAAVHVLQLMQPGERIGGPAIIESPVTTVVVEPGAAAELSPVGSIVITPGEPVGPLLAGAEATAGWVEARE